MEPVGLAVSPGLVSQLELLLLPCRSCPLMPRGVMGMAREVLALWVGICRGRGERGEGGGGGGGFRS